MVFVQNPRGNAQQNCWAESQQCTSEGPERLHDAVAGCCRERDCHTQLRQQVPEAKSQHVNKHKDLFSRNLLLYCCLFFVCLFLQVDSTSTVGAWGFYSFLKCCCSFSLGWRRSSQTHKRTEESLVRLRLVMTSKKLSREWKNWWAMLWPPWFTVLSC